MDGFPKNLTKPNRYYRYLKVLGLHFHLLVSKIFQLQVLRDQGVSVDEIKLYGESENYDALDESFSEDSFSELEAVMTKVQGHEIENSFAVAFYTCFVLVCVVFCPCTLMLNSTESDRLILKILAKS